VDRAHTVGAAHANRRADPTADRGGLPAHTNANADQAQDCTSPDTTLDSGGYLGTYGTEREFAPRQGDDDRANGDAEAGNRAIDVDTVERHPSLRILKHGPATANVRDRIVYTDRIALVGDGSPVRQIVVTDPLADRVPYTGGDDGDSVLEQGEAWVYTARYTVRTADRGALINVATALGIDINGDAVTATVSFTPRVPGQAIFLPLLLWLP
jgi:hypothetical protein